MNRPFAKQAALRLVLGLTLLGALIAFTMISFHSDAVHEIERERIEDLLTLYKTKFFQVDDDWRARSQDLRRSIEFSRILEKSALVDENLIAFLTTQGLEQRFQHLIIQAGGGERIFAFGDRLNIVNIPLAPEAESGYYLDNTTGQLYRLFQEPIWLGEKKRTGRIAVFFRMDNRMLYDMNGLNTALTLFYNDQPVANSLGQIVADPPRPRVAAGNQESRELTLVREAGDTLRLRVALPSTGSFLFLALAKEITATLLITGFIFSMTIGLWLLRQSRRITTLGKAIEEFSTFRHITERMDQYLMRAQGKNTDEIAQVARIIRVTAHEMVANSEELIQYRKHLEQLVDERTAQLNALHSRNQLILDTVGDGICGLDRSGCIIFSNPAMSWILGWSVEEMIGRNFHDLCHYAHPDGTPYPKEQCETHVKLSQCVVVHADVTTFWRRNGTPFLAEITATPLIEEGIANGEVLVFRDVTEIQAIRKEKQVNAAKSEFLANMSHEIRTPMNTIIGMGYLLTQTPLDPHQRDQVRKIQTAGQSLLRIIDDILDFSKIEANRLSLEQIPFDLSDIMEKVSAMIALDAEEKGLEILFDIPRSVPQILVGDPFRLEQILVNLGTNAVKFSEKGDITYRIREISADEQQFTLQFSVQDHGIGLSQEQIGKLFQAFTQADTSTTRHYGGTGLGLAICKRLVEMMGGKIWVESVLGQWSCFSFTAVFARSPQTLQRDPLRLASTLRGIRILIVDDNPSACQIVAGILQGIVSSVDAVHSGGKAIVALERATERNDPYQIVLLDWKMREMDGLETARQILRNPRLVQPTIIMMTAFSSQEVVKQSMDIGIEKFMLKPITPSLLFNNLMDIFETDLYHDHATQKTAEAYGVDVNLHGMRVLVVEDHDINWQVAEGILSKAGVIATRAENGQEAVRRIIDEAQHYDVVFMDLQMPIMDGYEATQLLRKHFSAEDLPIVAMTAHAIQSEKDRCSSLGMNDYVTKPVNVKGLYALLAGLRSEKSGTVTTPEAVAVIASPPVHQPNEALPEALPEIDLQQGLQRLDGDKALLARLIVTFSKHYVGVEFSSLQELLASGKTEEVQRFLHKLKGAAGTISAQAIHDLSVACENELVETGAIAESRLRRLGEKLLKVREAEQRIVEHLADLERQTHAPPPQVSALPSEWIADLQKGFSSGSYNVVGQFRTLLPSLRRLEIDPEVAALEEAVGRFDFSTALVYLARIEEALRKREV